MGHELMTIPNSPEGEWFWNNLTDYINRDFVALRRRGRGSRKNGGNQYGIPVDKATSWAIYADLKTIPRTSLQDVPRVLHGLDKMNEEINRVRAEATRWKKYFDEMTDKLDAEEDEHTRKMAKARDEANQAISRYVDQRNRYKEWGEFWHSELMAERKKFQKKQKQYVVGVWIITGIWALSLLVTMFR